MSRVIFAFCFKKIPKSHAALPLFLRFSTSPCGKPLAHRIHFLPFLTGSRLHFLTVSQPRAKRFFTPSKNTPSPVFPRYFPLFSTGECRKPQNTSSIFLPFYLHKYSIQFQTSVHGLAKVSHQLKQKERAETRGRRRNSTQVCAWEPASKKVFHRQLWETEGPVKMTVFLKIRLFFGQFSAFSLEFELSTASGKPC